MQCKWDSILKEFWSFQKKRRRRLHTIRRERTALHPWEKRTSRICKGSDHSDFSKMRSRRGDFSLKKKLFHKRRFVYVPFDFFDLLKRKFALEFLRVLLNFLHVLDLTSWPRFSLETNRYFSDRTTPFAAGTLQAVGIHWCISRSKIPPLGDPEVRHGALVDENAAPRH